MKKQSAIGNKNIKQYEEFIVDKTLIKKLTNVKSTICNQNDNFTR